MGKNIEKRNILFKNRMCSPIIEARSTKRGCESIVKYCFFIVLVLIDTWWNVNLFPALLPLASVLVLIDTWWNVNHTWDELQAKEVCFNRYMVECECVSSSDFQPAAY